MYSESLIEPFIYKFQKNILRDKVAFVTGGGSGICFTITEVLMRHGCDTVIASRNMERVVHSSKRLEEATGRKCMPLKLDVRKPKDVEDAFQKALDAFGRIDIVVNGAAGNFISSIANLSFNGFRTVMEIDAFGTFNVSKIAFEKYLRDHGGVIINISATLHYKGQLAQLHAGAAKASIDAMTKHMAVEWGPSGIRVIGVAPGPIRDTEGLRKLGGGVKEDDTTGVIPLGRWGTREEIANLVLFLTSPAASLITGETIVADGGAWLGSSNAFPGSKL